MGFFLSKTRGVSGHTSFLRALIIGVLLMLVGSACGQEPTLAATDRPFEVTEPLSVIGGPGTSAPFVSTDTETAALLFSTETETVAVIVPTETPVSISQLTIGSYVQFGRYNGEPILWRVIEDSANPDAVAGDAIIGDPMLLMDTTICNKPYDAAGPHDDSEERSIHGSNLWVTSNLRAWLNSSDPAGQVMWQDNNPPTADTVDSNPYADEKGFLADGNFTEHERNLIIPVNQKALLYYVDHKLAEGGSESFDYNSDIETAYNNYDDAFYMTVTDKVFLLDPLQVNGIYRRLRSYYRTAHDYWLRAPDTDIYTDSSPANVLYVRSDGVIMYRAANQGDVGVRAALVLDRNGVVFKYGHGYQLDPFVITE